MVICFKNVYEYCRSSRAIRTAEKPKRPIGAAIIASFLLFSTLRNIGARSTPLSLLSSLLFLFVLSISKKGRQQQQVSTLTDVPIEQGKAGKKGPTWRLALFADCLKRRFLPLRLGRAERTRVWFCNRAFSETRLKILRMCERASGLLFVIRNRQQTCLGCENE
jgi:hypothetical protein